MGIMCKVSGSDSASQPSSQSVSQSIRPIRSIRPRGGSSALVEKEQPYNNNLAASAAVRPTVLH